MSELDEIYKLRSQLEEAIRASFESMDFAAITRQNAPAQFQQARPRVDIKCAIGAATGHRFVCPDNIVRFDRWRFTLAVQAVTEPNPDPAQNNLHEAYLARVRGFVATLAQVSWTSDSFPNVLIHEPLRDSGATDSAVKDGVEYSTLSFTGIMGIRETAWPA